MLRGDCTSGLAVLALRPRVIAAALAATPLPFLEPLGTRLFSLALVHRKQPLCNLIRQTA